MDASDAPGDPVSGRGSPRRRLRLPNIAQAAAEFLDSEKRVSSGPISLLVMLAGAVVMAAFALFFEFGGLVFAAGLGSLVVGYTARRTLGCLALLLFWPGVGAAVAGGMLLVGLEAALPYWIAASFFFVWGFLGARSAIKGSPTRFLHSRAEAAAAGCHIGFFRPFNPASSEEARNVLLPLLRGYGTVYFVSDDSFDRARSLTEIEEVDVAVVDVSAPNADLAWAIRQCAARLPSYRIIFVASSTSVRPHDESMPLEEHHVEAFMAKAEPLRKRLRELGVEFQGTPPRCLVYPPDAAGHHWIANALFQAMTDIVAIENGWLDEIRQINQRSRFPIRDFNAANRRHRRRLIIEGDGASQLTVRTRTELTDVLAEFERTRSYAHNRFLVTIAVPVCQACWNESHADEAGARREADVPACDWSNRLVRCGLSPALVAVIQEQLAAGAVYVFCHGPCHRQLTYGRDDVYVDEIPFATYCAELMRGIDGRRRAQAERWVNRLIFTASAGLCSSCRAQLNSDEWSRAKLWQRPSPLFECRLCEGRGALTTEPPDTVRLHHPLTPTSIPTW